jgi:hypothetical membrane protein
MITIASVTGSVAVMISSTMVNVAIPSIMGAYGIEQTMAQWTATAFYAALVASQLLNSWVVAAVGERFAFCSMLFFFTIGSFNQHEHRSPHRRQNFSRHRRWHFGAVEHVRPDLRVPGR